MKKSTKRLIGITLAVVVFAAAFFFFFAPGWMFGGINTVTPDSTIKVIQFSHTRRTGLLHPSTFDIDVRTEHNLNPTQAAELSELLRNSWYRRVVMGRSTHFYSVPASVNQYYTFLIMIDDNINGFADFSVGWGGRIFMIGRSLSMFPRDNRSFWVQNFSGWQDELLRILTETDVGLQ
ncbi:MAG: hypothetical protein FWB98_01540 [Defluviitaleaceae bacterium]|nr:hypothetical protein [Defluviitaleaceae bacterium]